MLYTNFDLQPGYVEDSVPCTMKVYHNVGFASIREAVEHFRLTLVSFLQSEQQPPVRSKCCDKTLAFDEKSSFCCKCGTPLKLSAEISGYEVRELFMQLPMSTWDELAGRGIDVHLEDNGWTLGYYIDNSPACFVQSVNRWMEKDGDDDTPHLEGTYPDGTSWHSGMDQQ